MINQRKVLTAMALGLVVTLTACSKQSAEDKVKANITEGVHALTPEERTLADINAKQFFNRNFPQMQQDGSMGEAKGMFLDCRPSDSNFNGLVTCHGVMPIVKGGFNDKATRYCGYRKELVGCSDEDTVAK